MLKNGAGTSVPSEHNETHNNGTKVPTPVGYKQTKVGVIPEEWEETQLSSFIQEKIIYCNDEMIELGSLTIEKGVIPKPIRYQREHLVKNTTDAYKLVEDSDFVYNPMNLRFGALALYRNKKKLKVSTYYNIFNVDENIVNIDYIYAYLKSEKIMFYYNRMATGSLEEKKRVHFKEFKKFIFPLPPLKEQQKIAQILSTWDSAISKQEALIKAKEQLKKGLMQKLLSGEVRFKEFGAGTLVPSNKLGVEVSTSLNNHYNNGTKVPAPEWEEVRLGDVGKIIRGVSYKPNDLSPIDNNNTIRLMRSNNIKIGYLDTDEELQYVNKLKVKKSQKLLNGDLVICMANGSKNLVGKNGEYILEDTYSYTVGAFCAIFRFNGGIVNNFFRYLFQTNKYNYYVQNLLAGSNINNLKGNDIETMKFNVPTSFQEQQKIAQVLSTADKEITLLKEELEALKEQKRGLMQRLLSGDVRVVV